MEAFLRGMLGISVFIGALYLLSDNRKAISWKLVGSAFLAQLRHLLHLKAWLLFLTLLFSST